MKSILTICISLLFATSAFAAPLANDNDFSGAISFGMVNKQHTGNLSGDLSLSRYFGLGGLKKVLPQVGIRQGISYNFIENSRDQWALDTSGFVNLNLITNEEARLVPYVGTGLGVSYNDEDYSGNVSPEAGVKIFLDDAGQTYVGLAYRYLWDFSDTDIQDGSHNAFLRVGYVWGADRPSVSSLQEELQLANACCETNNKCCQKADAISRKFNEALKK